VKKIYQDTILNIPDTPLFDRTFCFDILYDIHSSKREIYSIRDLLAPKKNESIISRLSEKPAMWSEVYSPKDELEIFTQLFERALSENKKIHIVWITLAAELEILEKYYLELGFLREDINAFEVNFSLPLVTVTCHIENLMWKGSDYKAQREKIFFCPPIRESGQNKALFKGITRGIIAGIDFSQKNVGVSLVDTLEISQQNQTSGQAQSLPLQYQKFLQDCIIQEHILPLQMGKILKYNLQDAGFTGGERELQVKY
jgi:hypothetical protein